MASTHAKKHSEKEDKEILNTNLEQQPDQIFKLSSKNSSPLFAPEIDMTWLLLMGLAGAIRFYKFSTPASVVFDEVHYGKFTSYFMNRRFFFDVQPPLGKLIFAAAGYLSGFDGSFDFEEIGQAIPSEYMHHVFVLRVVPAVFGILLVPTVYEIVLELGCSYWFAVFGGLLVCFENMLVVQSRFLLLDSLLLSCIAFSVCLYIKFVKEYTRPFGLSWWLYLIGLGVSLTATFSIKYHGILTVLLIGGIASYELWMLAGDITVPARSVAGHIFARFGCLVFLPSFLYLVQFYILFSILIRSGPHDNMMSSAFQRTLEGGLSQITQNQADVIAYGSQITLRNTHSKQCWLHSHDELYPVKYDDGRGSSAQQQVTCYAFKDINNWWIVKNPHSDSLVTDFPPKPVMNGDIVNLVHGVTGRGLNSHDVGAPLNPQYMEVSGYIDHNVSMDAQFGFRLEILNPDASNAWRAIDSQIRFVHVNTSASIRISGQLLPEWGFHQYEVATDRMIGTQESVWNVEEHNQNITIPQNITESEAKAILEERNMPIEINDLSFFEMFLELQTRMLKDTGQNIKEHMFASRPLEWPILYKGVAYWIDSQSNKQVFCMGNPIIWWGGSLVVLLYVALLVIYLLRRRRFVFDISHEEWNLFVVTGYLLVGGYFLNLVMFIPSEKTLFIYQYLPAYLFKITLIAVLADHFNNTLFNNLPILQTMFKCGCVVYILFVMWSFHYFSTFTYADTSLSSREIHNKKWLLSWGFLAHDNL